jgi:sec-independent protein translocase protein TatC
MAKPAVGPAEQEERAKEAELEEGRMPFLSHLGELRDRVRNAAIAFGLAFLACWGFSGKIFEWLRQPLYDIWILHPEWGPPQLIATVITQPFWVNMSVALWAGIFVSSPIVFYQLWRFIAPGLYRRERKIGISFAVLSAVFFVAGALFCFYFALPALFRYMLGYNSVDLKVMPSIQDYLDLTRDSMLAFGAIFEMPLLIYFLAMVGMVTHRSLWKFSRWFVVLAFVVGAILTPGPDVVSQFLMALPMIGLYNISILFAWRVTVKRERAAAEQRAREDAMEPRKPPGGADSAADSGSSDDDAGSSG